MIIIKSLSVLIIMIKSLYDFGGYDCVIHNRMDKQGFNISEFVKSVC